MSAPTIDTVQDQERGCGWRKPGGFYLMGGTEGITCGKLPVALHVCPTCGQGVKPSRSWTWLDPRPIVGAGVDCSTDPPGEYGGGWVCHAGCQLLSPDPRVGLIWVGGAHYPEPDAFTAEAARLGVSRRVTQIPRGFEIGKTWVYLAHRKAVQVRNYDDRMRLYTEDVPGIFYVFRPTRIEYVVADDDHAEKLERLAKRGVRLVRIERIEAEQATLL